jgi:hypothetical protein
MCTFEEYPRNNINYEVRIRDLRCAREVGDYSWGLKVCKRSFLGVLRVRYEVNKVYDVEKCNVLRL